MTSLLALLGAGLLAASGVLAWLGFRARREARVQLDDLAWIDRQVGRAVKLLESTDDDEVMVGLQLLRVLHDAETRAHVAPKVLALSQLPVGPVSEQAQVTLKAIQARRDP